MKWSRLRTHAKLTGTGKSRLLSRTTYTLPLFSLLVRRQIQRLLGSGSIKIIEADNLHSCTPEHRRVKSSKITRLHNYNTMAERVSSTFAMSNHECQTDVTEITNRLGANIHDTRLRMAKQQQRQTGAYLLDLEPIGLTGLQRRNAIRIPAGRKRPCICQPQKLREEELFAEHTANECNSETGKCVYCIVASRENVQTRGRKAMELSSGVHCMNATTPDMRTGRKAFELTREMQCMVAVYSDQLAEGRKAMEISREGLLEKPLRRRAVPLYDIRTTPRMLPGNVPHHTPSLSSSDVSRCCGLMDLVAFWESRNKI